MTNSLGIYRALAVSWLLGACSGSAAGTQPLDQSAAAHQAAAAHEEAQSGEHSHEYDANARADGTCDRPQGDGCWADIVNPTEEHRERAEQHRERAAQHRAASRALLDAEARACVGVGDADRDMSPFAHKGDIASVSVLNRQTTGYAGTRELGTVAGATIVFRAVPGATAQWLQRIVECHLARNAALGFDAMSTEMAYCPLSVRGAQATVRALSNGYAVEVRSEDEGAAREILRRAQALTASP